MYIFSPDLSPNILHFDAIFSDIFIWAFDYSLLEYKNTILCIDHIACNNLLNSLISASVFFVLFCFCILHWIFYTTVSSIFFFLNLGSFYFFFWLYCMTINISLASNLCYMWVEMVRINILVNILFLFLLKGGEAFSFSPLSTLLPIEAFFHFEGILYIYSFLRVFMRSRYWILSNDFFGIYCQRWPCDFPFLIS